jgi:SAM-dependent methyltransferase
VDLTPKMLEGARAAAAREGVTACAFVEGDAQALPLPDDAFDVALSTFGCMFAPDQTRTAAELARVVRPGGRIGFTGWIPDGGPGAFLRLLSPYLPPPPAGAGIPLAWGDEDHVRALFAQAAPGSQASMSRLRVSVVFDSVDDAVTTYTSQFGPLVLARPALEEAGTWDALCDALREFFGAMPASHSGGVLMDSDYLQTVVHTSA